MKIVLSFERATIHWIAVVVSMGMPDNALGMFSGWLVVSVSQQSHLHRVGA